ncbi:GNAT family N-acetyltransferase [Streptomyces sp. NPDC058171]
MTTTLRPTGPLQQLADGGRSRHFRICVNSRPVGEIDLATDERFGPRVARVRALRVDEPDRGRGRGTVAALAAEEVARGWGCRRIEASVPADAPVALRLGRALGYVERNRLMALHLDRAAPSLPDGPVRPMTPAEYGPWRTTSEEAYVGDWIERGVPEDEARAKAERDYLRLLPDGLDTPGAAISVLEHRGTVVGTIWVAHGAESSYVYEVEVVPEHRGHGHGRTLMRHAAAQALAAGHRTLGLNVFLGNTPALRLYESLGFESTVHHLYKPL